MDHFVGILTQLQASKRKAVTYEKSRIQNVSDEQFNNNREMSIQLQQQKHNLEEIRERQQVLILN